MIVKHVGSLPSTKIYYNLGSIILFLLIVRFGSFPILPIEEPFKAYCIRVPCILYLTVYCIRIPDTVMDSHKMTKPMF